MDAPEENPSSTVSKMLDGEILCSCPAPLQDPTGKLKPASKLLQAGITKVRQEVHMSVPINK